MREWDDERFQRSRGLGMSRSPEGDDTGSRGYDPMWQREDPARSRRDFGPYGGYPGPTYRRSEFGAQGYEEEDASGSFGREYDEETRMGWQREPYPRNAWNPEPQYGREGRQRGQQRGRGYGGGQFGGEYEGSRYGGSQYGGQSGRGSYGSMGSPTSSRRGYSSFGEPNFHGGRDERDEETWNRSGSEWSGMSQGFGRSEQRSMSSGSSRTNRGPKNYKRSDERIKEDVCDRLSQSDLNCEDVEINVKNGEVTLTGTTDSGHERREIERVAETIPGVQDVTNQIRIKRETSRTGDSRTSEGRSMSSSAESSATRREAMKTS